MRGFASRLAKANDASFSPLRSPLEHHCRNHNDPRDGDDVNAPALFIGHVGSFAFRVGPNRPPRRIPTALFDRRAGIMNLAPIPRFGARLESHRRDIEAGHNKVALDAAHG